MYWNSKLRILNIDGIDSANIKIENRGILYQFINGLYEANSQGVL